MNALEAGYFLSDVSIILLSYNRGEMLAKNLPPLLDLVEKTGCELVVVDNHSEDGAADIISDILRCRRNVHFVLSDRNWGVSEGRNIGWRIASGDFVISIDDDIELSVQAVVDMVAAARAEPDTGLVSPDIVDSTSRRIINKDCREVEGSAAFFYEACFLVPRRVLDHIGQLDPELAIAGEGLDFSFRLRKAGYRIRRISSAHVVHVDRVRTGAASAGRRRKWLWSFCYVYWKNLDAIPAIWRSVRILLAHVKAGFRLFGMSFVASLPSCALSGARAGRTARKGWISSSS